jgi:diphthamide synthase (EF-2-diphthine--ammonia ligase)
MFQYTKNNHIECSFSDGVLDFKHGKCNSHKSWREECKNVAQELYDLHGDKLIVTLSGGLDSEVVLHSFIANGIVPNVVIFRYERNLNLHDINYALRICAARQISPKIVDINVSRFFTTNLLDYANITKCSSPQLNLLMKSIDNLDGIPIIGAGENYLSRKEGEKEVYDLEEAKIAAIYKFYKNKEREIIPAFFQYTPEIMISYLQKESVYRWVETAKQQKYINSKKIKPSIIAEDFDIEPRGKLTGFELIDDLEKQQRNVLINKRLGDDGEQWTKFEDYIKGFGIDLLRNINYV